MPWLSKKRAFILWILLVVGTGGAVFVDCIYQSTCALKFVSSVLSALLALLGTVLLALPSIIFDLGETDIIRRTEQFSKDLYSTFKYVDGLDVGDTLDEDSDEYEQIATFVQVYKDYEPEISTISKGPMSGNIDYYVSINNGDLEIKKSDVRDKMMYIEEKLEEEEEEIEEKQERLYVLLGCAVYGIAIGFQSLSPIVSYFNW